ncbi:hypothetical protein PGIGA_G00137750 [Pangasianodon gigas]|uniref:Uncharacterized protein n=1 Tax=Pangasianodon gigas TaxID=30993 RepID=A0ACC5XKI2_PANGG|nr:hypothetical protein [Pangasianodon gigas]
MPSGVEYGELGESLPAISSLNASFSQASLSAHSSHYLPLPPTERRSISDVRRTFCLFVTFDLLFVSLLWIIELNASLSAHSSHYLPLPPTERRSISDVRRTFCLFVTFDLLFVSLLWIIELNINKSIWLNLEKEVVRYDFRSSFFDILVSRFLEKL